MKLVASQLGHVLTMFVINPPHDGDSPIQTSLPSALGAVAGGWAAAREHRRCCAAGDGEAAPAPPARKANSMGPIYPYCCVEPIFFLPQRTKGK
jgi:hypothetical protein